MRRRLQQLENEKSAVTKKAVKRDNDLHPESQESSEDYILDEPYETPLDRENDQDFQPITNQLTEHQQQVLKAQADECRSEAYGAMEQFPDPDFDISLLELCCPPDSRLAQTFLDHGKRALRVGLPAIDFGKKSGLQEVLNMIDKWKPKVLWISLPCGPYPPIQEIFNESTPEMLQKSLERKKKAKKLISHGITAARHQVNRGGEVGWEWPVNNPGWELPLVRKFWHELENAGPAFSARVDGCSYGMTGPKNMPLKKPWKIRTTSQTLARAVHRLCPGHECHEECLGGKTARDSGFYPQSMCNVIYKSVQEMMACRPNYDVFPAAYPVFDTKDMMEIEEKKKHVRPLTEEEKKQVSKLVDRLHRRTGHPSNVALAGVLRHRGAHPEVIQLAAQNQCNECQELRSAPLHAIAAIEKSETLWETVVIDNMEFTADGGIHHYMVLVDEASRLMNAYHLFSHGPAESRNATAEEVTDALGNWCLHYGMPAKVRLDPEGAFRLTLLGQWASERGIELVFCAAEDHGQIGIVERAIATLKSTIRQILQGGDYTVKQAVVSACCTHNTLERVEGYSPFQWAFGRQPTLTGRMHEKGYDDPWWTSSAVPGSSVMQNLRLRVKAQQSFLQAQSHELISRAANSKTREKTIAEGMNAPTAVWTFHTLAKDTLKGEYEILDDHMFPEDVTATRSSEPDNTVDYPTKFFCYEPDAMASRAAGRPMHELFEQPLFKRQRKQLAATSDDELLATSFFAADGELHVGNMACCIELPVPQSSSELRRMKRDPETYFVRKVKGAEVKWSARLQQKARSSLAAEAQALAECDQELMFCRLAFMELRGKQ
ncbi:unnamed protein product [Durusdinium trenchii]|uniref:Integrase catalytic domain-containing protein n=1 Tax=Durusdinium trenchii TaxID=1381693 RepID=A0ABP0M8R1_9DINO